MIDQFMSWFPSITKEESDYIAEILTWDDEKRSAFMFAKGIFEDKEDD